jgi:branched-chain amino acid transport system ATP-binding protein
MELLARVSRSGPTVMIVEQNAQQALQYADRIYVLSQGAVVLSGKSAELARDPNLLAAYLGRA